MSEHQLNSIETLLLGVRIILFDYYKKKSLTLAFCIYHKKKTKQKNDKPLEPVRYTNFTAEKGILNTLNHGEISLLEAHCFNITHALKKFTKLD